MTSAMAGRAARMSTYPPPRRTSSAAAGRISRTLVRRRVWNNDPRRTTGEGTGGGYSTLFPMPSWQAGAPHGPGRLIPDVAANADPTPATRSSLRRLHGRRRDQRCGAALRGAIRFVRDETRLHYAGIVLEQRLLHRHHARRQRRLSRPDWC